MRRAIAIHGCFALLAAFLLAPFQHVHHDEAAEGHHEHAPLVHSHFYAHGDPHHPAAGHTSGPEIEAGEDEDEASPLDTFLVVLTAELPPLIPSRAPLVVPPPVETRLSFERIDERGHDPPARTSTSPRAPPV